MLLEHFVGNMENGAADFTTGAARLAEWDKPASWDWENVVMLSNHVHHKPWGEAEPLLVSNTPKSSSNSSAAAADLKLVKHESLHAAPDTAAPAPPPLNMGMTTPRSQAEKPKVMNLPEGNSQQDFLLGLGGQESNNISNNNNAAKDSELGVSEGSLGQDAEIGLKLGLKRSFTPDASPPAPTTTTGTAAAAAAAGGGTQPSLSRGNSAAKPPPGNSKRSRGSAHHIPRCQVEGCRTDLSSAKDYHRRHKVCAMHSKSAKVSVNSIEQRFCQQCSRFHVLSEFDEGKRSCRRRLAGHNERRRKPQPDPMQLTALAPYQAGFMRLARDDRVFGYGAPLSYLGLDSFHGKLAWPRLGSIEDHSLVSSLGSARVPERFFMLFPQRKTPLHQLNGGYATSHHPFVQQHHHQGTGSMGQNLTLCSSSSDGPGGGGGGGLYPGLGAATINQTQTPVGVTAGDSGRALSLLSSSQSWPTHDSMEQVLMPDSKRYSSAGAPTGGSPRGYGSQPIAALEGAGAPQQGSGYLPGLGVNNYENNSVLTLLQEPDYHHHHPHRGGGGAGGGLSETPPQQQQQQQQHSRPTIDLMMQMSAQQQAPNGATQHHISYGSPAIYDPHHL